MLENTKSMHPIVSVVSNVLPQSNFTFLENPLMEHSLISIAILQSEKTLAIVVSIIHSDALDELILVELSLKDFTCFFFLQHSFTMELCLLKFSFIFKCRT
jgi:hypothetical protein